MSSWILAAALLIGVGGGAAFAAPAHEHVAIERSALWGKTADKPGEEEAASFDATPDERQRGKPADLSRDDGQEDLTGSIARTDGDDTDVSRREPFKPTDLSSRALGEEDNAAGKMDKPRDLAARQEADDDYTGSITSQSEDRSKPAARGDEAAVDDEENHGRGIERDGDEPRELAERSDKPGSNEDND